MGIREDSEYLRFSEVESIQLVGEEEVWDIEVEEDHSYVAHGMVHHNSCRGPNVQQAPEWFKAALYPQPAMPSCTGTFACGPERRFYWLTGLGDRWMRSSGAGKRLL
jgi:hypothetical protein